MPPVLHVARRADWEAAQASGTYPIPGGGPFIHCCFPDQLAGVLARFFAGADDLLQLTIDPRGLPLVVEPAEDGAGDFPHLHDGLPVASVVDVRPV
ncbi:MAG: hypothetical protein QOH43_2979 [Solirubrobacteraceae bacterium]|nr:hypothetical protein [Solirubrobacteraceae bacterium]